MADAPKPESVFTLPPVVSVDEAIARMEEIQQTVAADPPVGPPDGLGAFNHLYTAVTKHVHEEILAGTFADTEFITQLDVVFANRYFDALRVFVNEGKAAPRAWRALLERRYDGEVEDIQFAVAGVNAHINFDLPLAVVATCDLLGTDPDDGAQHASYLQINAILAEAMEATLAPYRKALTGPVDEAVRPAVRVVGNWSVVTARDAAWEVVGQLWTLRRFRIPESPFVARLDGLTALAGHLLLTPLR